MGEGAMSSEQAIDLFALELERVVAKFGFRSVTCVVYATDADAEERAPTVVRVPGCGCGDPSCFDNSMRFILEDLTDLLEENSGPGRDPSKTVGQA